MLESSTLAATSTTSCSVRLYRHMLGLLLCPAKSTVSNIICARGGQHADWTADYRLYSKDRVDESVLFGRVRDTLIENLAPGEPLVVGYRLRNGSRMLYPKFGNGNHGFHG